MTNKYLLFQNDEVFTFQFNIIVMDAKDQQSRYPLSRTCSLLLPWSQREVICEEDYMEAQNIANSAWQVMFLKNEDEMATMPITEAHRLGYELSATPKRVIFRSPYRQTHSEIIMVDGVAVEVIHGTVFFSQKMMVVMIDISVACTINPGYFDGVRLLWETPRIMTPLVHSGFGFESKQINVGVESQLLDEGTARARGYTLEVKGLMVQMGVPFGAEGGYRKSLVTNNIYREMYVAFLFYEHVFSHVYTDGSTVETRHRLLRVVDTPLLMFILFAHNEHTSFEEHTFNVYLGNIPHDVALMGVKLNEKQFSVSDAAEHGYTISKIVHANGTHAYTIRVPFDDKAGLFQYSMDMNYTLSIMPQEEAYYHLASVMEQLIPPELKGVCTRGGIVFDMTQPRLGYLWEIGVGHDPLTPELVAERGYNLRNESHILTLEVPLFTVGYTYEDINLRHFYGIFEIHSRDSRTSEIQTATATRCLFRRDQLIICSTDGIMTVLTSTKPTWPAVNPRSTTLLDRTCKPKLMDDSRVLFEFGLNTCNTTVMSQMSLINLIKKCGLTVAAYGTPLNDLSFFRLSVRCLYPHSSVSRLFVDRTFKSQMSGVGSIKFTGSNKGKIVLHNYM
uniref:ZP domain-containing protein n=1 Tax=Oncorhynchus tshawytscha TaxID=74940 RepID=A0AAZ3P1G5_ONCTS